MKDRMGVKKFEVLGRTGCIDNKIYWLLFWIITPALIFLRKPDSFLYAQPWAEDGAVWLSELYNNGLRSLFEPHTGYFQTLPRLASGLGLLFGLDNVALVTNIIAALVRIFFLAFVLSSRMSFVNIRYRILFCLWFLFRPNVVEAYMNISGAHWYLSMYLMAVIIANEARTKLWKVHDIAVLILSGLSGPFIIFNIIGLGIRRLHEHKSVKAAFKHINTFDVLAILCAVIQIVSLIFTRDRLRVNSPLVGNGLTTLADIISYRVIHDTIFPSVPLLTLKNIHMFNIVVTLLFVFIVACLFATKNWRFKAIIASSVFTLAGGLYSPVLMDPEARWYAFLRNVTGERYFYIPHSAMMCLFIYFVYRGLEQVGAHPNFASAKRVLTFALVLCMFIGVVGNFRLPAYQDVGYKEQVAEFMKLAKGESREINIQPPGGKMKLIKR